MFVLGDSLVEMAEGHHLYDKSHNYHSSIINDEKNPYLLITREELTAKYQLKHHPIHQGRYNEVYRSPLYVSIEDPVQGNKKFSRSASTNSYYLLANNEICLLHRIPFDQTFHFYLGKPVVLVLLKEETQSYSEKVLGNNLEKNEVLSFTVPANTWFGAYMITSTEHLSKYDREDKAIADHTTNLIIRKKADEPDQIVHDRQEPVKISDNVEIVNPESFNYALIGCTVSPGIEEEDIEVGDANHLISAFPSAMDRIHLLTKSTAEISKTNH